MPTKKEGNKLINFLKEDFEKISYKRYYGIPIFEDDENDKYNFDVVKFYDKLDKEYKHYITEIQYGTYQKYFHIINISDLDFSKKLIEWLNTEEGFKWIIRNLHYLIDTKKKEEEENWKNYHTTLTINSSIKRLKGITYNIGGKIYSVRIKVYCTFIYPF